VVKVELSPAGAKRRLWANYLYRLGGFLATMEDGRKEAVNMLPYFFEG